MKILAPGTPLKLAALEGSPIKNGSQERSTVPSIQRWWADGSYTHHYVDAGCVEPLAFHDAVQELCKGGFAEIVHLMEPVIRPQAAGVAECTVGLCQCLNAVVRVYPLS